MKNSLLIALLGLTVSVVTPSIATADDFKFGPNKSYKNDQNKGHKHNNRHAKKHVAKQHNRKHRVARAKPPKLPHQRLIAKHKNKIHNRHNKRHDNKRHHNKSKPSFSITWMESGFAFGASIDAQVLLEATYWRLVSSVPAVIVGAEELTQLANFSAGFGVQF